MSPLWQNNLTVYFVIMILKPCINRKLLVLVLLALVLKVVSLSPGFVERYYANGVYPYISVFFRRLFGPFPFSIGDLLYAAAAIYLCLLLIKAFKKWKAGYRRQLLLRFCLWLLHTALGVYFVFQLLWGLNYSRQGIGIQTGLKPVPYTVNDLDTIAVRITGRLKETAQLINKSGRAALDNRTVLKRAGLDAYKAAENQFPFLTYRAPSIKWSLFSSVGHLVGFTGYYNPFTAEAQVKSDIPHFLKPFVVTHEMAHQLGYARESEANFVAFLTCRSSPNNEVRYAVYFEMFVYTLSELGRADSVAARRYRDGAPLEVKADLQTLLDYLERSRNPVEPYISMLYDTYLRWNNQPKGRQSYNEVVAWMIAYGKKNGWENI